MDDSSEEITYEEEKLENTSSTILQCAKLS